MGLSSSQTGLVMAASGLFSALLQPFLANLADRPHGATTKRLSVFLCVPACLLLVFVWLPLGSGPLDVVLYALAWTLLVALQFLISSFGMECAAAGIPLNFGAGRALGSLGYALFSYMLGIVAARFGAGIILSFAALFCVFLCASLLSWKGAKRPEPAPQDLRETQARTFFSRYPRFAVFVAGSFLVMIAYCMSCCFLVRIVENLGGGSAELGTTIMITALCEIPTIFVSLRLRKRFGSSRLMVFASIMLSVKALLLLLAPSITLLYAAMLSQIFSYSLFIPISVYYADARMQTGDKARGQAMMALIPTVGNAAGSLLGGVLLDAFGVPGMLLFCFCCSALGTVIMIAGTEKVQ